jgi:membrane protease YdiL (CAAX protease family)
MEEEFIATQRPAWVSAILLILVGTVGFVIVGFLLGFLIAIPFMDGSMLSFIPKLDHPLDHPEIKTPLFIIQAGVTFFGLAALPALYWWTFEKQNPLHLLKSKATPFLIFLLTAFIVFSFVPVISLFTEWNSNVKFPEFLGGFDQWARETETKTHDLMILFTKFDSFGQFMFAFFTISILAGFSEEFFFRGMLQPILKTAIGNIHWAIWITAIFFSAIHLEFFGFVPRMLLGALFGYLYYWSGNLVLAMLGHMVNNGLGVLAMYLNQKGKLNFDVESTEALPIPAVIGGFVFFTLLLVYFNRFYKTTTPTSA